MKRLAFAFLILGTARLAVADVPGPQPDFGEKPVVSYESPQHFSIEVKFTPYSPHIDHSKGLNGATPFADLFNSRKINGAGVVTNKGDQPPYRLLTSIEFDYQILHRQWGTLGVGATGGFYRRTTHSFIYNTVVGADGQAMLVSCALATCQRSGDSTGLNILPLTALVEYRYDYAANHYHVPLIPYIRGGLAYYIWWINDGNGVLSGAVYPRPPTTLKQTTGYGGSFGIVLNPGIALQLDWLDRSAAITMDHELGINHIYLFAELSYAWVNGFNASNKLDLSDTMVTSGVGFEF